MSQVASSAEQRDGSEIDAARDHEGGPEPRPRPRRTLTIAAAVLGALVLFLVITSFTGLPGPGMLRRYPYADLHDLSRAIDAQAGELRTPDDCWRTLTGSTGPIREIVRVDNVRSRVVVRAYAGQSGHIDPVTFNAVADKVQTAIDSDPGFTWRMVEIEPSPDGWSPLVSCQRVTRGFVTGF